MRKSSYRSFESKLLNKTAYGWDQSGEVKTDEALHLTDIRFLESTPHPNRGTVGVAGKQLDPSVSLYHGTSLSEWGRRKPGETITLTTNEKDARIASSEAVERGMVAGTLTKGLLRQEPLVVCIQFIDLVEEQLVPDPNYAEVHPEDPWQRSYEATKTFAVILTDGLKEKFKRI